MKLLVIRFSSIGDIILTTPVVRCIKKQLTGVELHYLTKKVYQEVLTGNPFIDRIHLLDDNLLELTQQMKREKFDYVIDLHHNLRTYWVKLVLGVPSMSFRKLNMEKWLITAMKINILPDVHIVQRYLETVESIGVTDDGGGLDYFIPPPDEVDVNSLPAGFEKGYLAFGIGGKWATKKLPVGKIISICIRLNKPVVLIGGKEDEKAGEFIASSARKNVFNGCGKYSINQSASLVKNSQLVISHDTAVMHMGAAAGKKVISLWGNTIPGFGMYPYYGRAGGKDTGKWMAEVKGLSCRPCSKIGYNKCPRGHFRCMKEMDEARILSLVNESWQEL